MSKHVSRRQRWAEEGPRRYHSLWGRVFYERGAWYGLLAYRLREQPRHEGGMAAWLPRDERLGPFKRPRNAMVAVEREATYLMNRHGKEVLFGDRIWAEA